MPGVRSGGPEASPLWVQCPPSGRFHPCLATWAGFGDPPAPRDSTPQAMQRPSSGLFWMAERVVTLWVKYKDIHCCTVSNSKQWETLQMSRELTVAWRWTRGNCCFYGSEMVRLISWFNPTHLPNTKHCSSFRRFVRRGKLAVECTGEEGGLAMSSVTWVCITSMCWSCRACHKGTQSMWTAGILGGGVGCNWVTKDQCSKPCILWYLKIFKWSFIS